jgi:hypothetical protein
MREEHVAIGSDSGFESFELSEKYVEESRKAIASRTKTGVAVLDEVRPMSVVGFSLLRRAAVIAERRLKHA